MQQENSSEVGETICNGQRFPTTIGLFVDFFTNNPMAAILHPEDKNVIVIEATSLERGKILLPGYCSAIPGMLYLVC